VKVTHARLVALRTIGDAGSSEPAADAPSPFDSSHRRVTFDVQIQELMMTSTADR
jgi:hypothetical protein